MFCRSKRHSKKYTNIPCVLKKNKVFKTRTKIRFCLFFLVFIVLFYRFTTTASFCFWRNLKVSKIPNKIRISYFFVFLTSIFIFSPLLHRKVYYCPFWSMRVIFRRLRVVFGLKKVILGLCDPIFLALGVKYIALFGILRVGWFTPIFLKNSSNDTMSFFDLYQIMDLLCLVSPWLAKRRARFPAFRMKVKASGNRFWACMRQFCDLGVNFWPRKVIFDPWDSILSLWDSISSLWKFTSGHKKANLGFWESILGA